MSLVSKQWQFIKDLKKLIDYIEKSGYIVTGGELWRHPYMQEYYLKTGRSKTMHSQHLKRLAIDLNFFRPARHGESASVFIEGKPFVLTWNISDIEQFGRFWESLSPDNRWGGNFNSFKDVPHFEKK
ncbi:M15 family metallopeptidase [Desulfurobacterium atlanticum]|uniref:D-alanyl-D-alanine carboxypeptidase n=1 Tax=Desulfurobacterium atlanticum TaxID=240169 RepID=A0A238ZIN9_9BACT|nr:M15 family metallopeptidase [Desulfurobacterium atlanticum]SNR83336.1 D-alanyl-D-alanine carboxypeptidase [Desulfurobacterium atlanticum]